LKRRARFGLHARVWCLYITGSNPTKDDDQGDGQRASWDWAARSSRTRDLNSHIGVRSPCSSWTAATAPRSSNGHERAGEIALLTRLPPPPWGDHEHRAGASQVPEEHGQRGAGRRGSFWRRWTRAGRGPDADDSYYGMLRERFSGTVRSFGIENHAEVMARDIRQGGKRHIHDRCRGLFNGLRLPAVGCTMC